MRNQTLLPLALATAVAAVATASPPASAAAAVTTTVEQRAAAHAAAAERLRAQDYAGMVRILEPLTADPQLPAPLRTQLGLAYNELGRPADALKVLAPVAEREDAPPPLLYQAWRAASASGDLPKATSYLERAAAKEPASVAARTLGMRYGAEGKFREACGLLLPYVAANAGDADARLSAAYCALELDQQETTTQLLAGLRADEPHVRLLRARIAMRAKQPDEIVAQLEPLVASPPADLAREVRRLLAEAYLATGKGSAAAALLAETHAGDAGLTLLFARAQQLAGNPQAVVDAVAPFADAIAAGSSPDGTPVAVLAGLALENGRALLALHRAPEAVTALQAATRLDAASEPAWQALAQALRRAGRNEEAQKALDWVQALAASQSN